MFSEGTDTKASTGIVTPCGGFYLADINYPKTYPSISQTVKEVIP
jgi:hypothetical protein